MAIPPYRLPGVISAQKSEGPSRTEDQIPKELGGDAPERMTDDEIVTALEGYRLEGEYARLSGPNSRDRTWLEHLDLYYNRWDFTKKAPWQAHEVMPEFPQYVDRFAAAMRMALVAAPHFYTISVHNDKEGDIAYVIRKAMDVVLARIGRNPSGHRVDFSAQFEEAMKMAALAMAVVKVTIKNDGKCNYTSSEIIDPYNYWFDPTGRNLYRFHREELDLHELRKLGELKDKEGNYLFRHDAIQSALHDDSAMQAIMRAEREKRTGTGQWTMSNRRPVILHEYYCDLIDNEGYVRAEKCLFIVANNKWLIRGQAPDGEAGEPNPFWHGKDWMVATPIITVPLAPYGRSYAENFASITKTFNEMTNLLLDSIMVSTMKVFSVVPGYMEDPSQLEDGIYPNAMFRLIEGIEQEQFMRAVDLGTADQQGFAMLQLLKKELQEGAAFNEMTMGQASPNARTSATEVSTVDQNSTQYMRAIASNAETLLLEPWLDLIWKSTIQGLDKNDEEMKNAIGEQWFNTLLRRKKEFAEYKVTFICRGITSLLARKQKLNEFIQFLQVVAANQPLTQTMLQQWPAAKLFNYFVQLMDIDTAQLEGSQRDMQMQDLQNQRAAQENQSKAQQQMADQANAKGLEAKAVLPAKIAEAHAKEEAKGIRESKVQAVKHLFTERGKNNDMNRELKMRLLDHLFGQAGIGGEGGTEDQDQGGDNDEGGNQAAPQPGANA